MDDELAWQTVERETAYSCPGFDVVAERVRLPDGTETDFDYLSEPAAVVVVPLTPDDEVVCIEEWRQAVGRVNRGLPAGGTEPGEDDPLAAARRELREETGYEADDLEHLETVEPANGIADSVHHYVLATGCRPTGSQDLDDDETIRVAPTPLAELHEDVLAGRVRDGRTVLGVLQLAARSERI